MFRASFGFIVNNSVQIDIHHRRVVRLDLEEHGSNQAISVNVITLKETQMFLLAYLLAKAVKMPVSREDILKTVWDERNLKSSSQILWSTLKELKGNLALVGLGADFISIAKGSTYKVNVQEIQSLYFVS